MSFFGTDHHYGLDREIPPTALCPDERVRSVEVHFDGVPAFARALCCKIDYYWSWCIQLVVGVFVSGFRKRFYDEHRSTTKLVIQPFYSSSIGMDPLPHIL